MIKHIAHCSSYFGYGSINHSVHAITCEFIHDPLVTNAMLSHEDLSDFLQYVVEQFPGASCYLYIKIYGVSPLGIKLGVLKRAGIIDITQCLNTIILNAKDDTTSLIAEFAISDVDQVLRLLNTHSFSTVAIISDPNDSNNMSEVIALFEQNFMNEVINLGCVVGKAVLTCICGNDGTTFCCFQLHDS